jgi:hypothetical protein
MRYRVKFKFWQDTVPYYTQWFDTLTEACRFTDASDSKGTLFIHFIEDSDGKMV